MSGTNGMKISGHEIGALVIDPGHHSIKVGYAQENTFNADVPAVVGEPATVIPGPEETLPDGNVTQSVAALSSPPSLMNKGVSKNLVPADISKLHLDSKDDNSVISEKPPLMRRISVSSRSSSLSYGDSLFDVTSLAASDDTSVYCGPLKKPRKTEEEKQRDLNMWRASNVDVMQNLLSRRGTIDEQLKWEAIATARGLCTLTDSCTCRDCKKAKYLKGVTDGNGGLGETQLLNDIPVGCQIQ